LGSRVSNAHVRKYSGKNQRRGKFVAQGYVVHDESLCIPCNDRKDRNYNSNKETPMNAFARNAAATPTLPDIVLGMMAR
jgi:hypothetical protein